MNFYQELGLILFATIMLALWLWVKDKERYDDDE